MSKRVVRERVPLAIHGYFVYQVHVQYSEAPHLNTWELVQAISPSQACKILMDDFGDSALERVFSARRIWVLKRCE